MAVLVGYRCRHCGFALDQFVPSPPPAEIPCGSCGAAARRDWSPISVGGRARQPSVEHSTAPTGATCRTNQDIPGLCMFSPTAARALVARVRRDNRALEKELAYQEHMQKDAPGTLHVGGHAHGPQHGCSAGTGASTAPHLDSAPA